jgi:hypothetical protein
LHSNKASTEGGGPELASSSGLFIPYTKNFPFFKCQKTGGGNGSQNKTI